MIQYICKIIKNVSCFIFTEASQTACSPKVHTGDSAITGYEMIVFSVQSEKYSSFYCDLGLFV